jgi:salicylate hydroxylase
MPMKNTPHVLIAGAGLGGLTAALALLRRGITVDVFEQATELREVGAGLQLAANGNRALFDLGLEAPMRQWACEAAGKEIRLWSTGQTWKLFDLGQESVARYGFPYFTMYRPDLLSILADAVRALKPDGIHLGARCVDLRQDADGVRLILEDGSAVAGDALIAGDGVRSRVRQVLFGDDQPKFTGIMAWRATVPMDRVPAHMRRPVATNWVGPGSHIVHYPVHRGDRMNVVAVLERDDWTIESWTTRGSHDECRRDFAGWNSDVQALIDGAPELFKWALMLREPREQWTVGRVSLLGDAAHPTLPMLAQGANMAFEDGYLLARCIERWPSDIPTALQRYEAARRDRTKGVVVGSAAATKIFHNRALADPAGAQAYVDREWQEDRIRERYEWLFTYDVTRVAI